MKTAPKFAPFMGYLARLLNTLLPALVVLGWIPVWLSAQDVPSETILGDGVVALDLAADEVDESRFDELMEEARLIFVDAVVADKSGDTLEAAYYFDLLFEAMADVEQLPMLDELQRLEFNRFLNATIAFYETDSQALEKVETSLTVSALRDELSRYTRAFPADLGAISELELNGEGHIPIVYNDRVARIIQFFRTQGRRNMQVWLNRLSRYRRIIEPILEQEEVPEQLVFLALVESGLNPRAYSWKHAVGPWQFISSTGRRYGLKRDWWRDERRDFEKSTLAAARYLKDLYAEFGDWYLAMAAYNTGEARVRRAIRVHQTTDFWKLYILPRQTRNYIPNIMATFLIGQDPEKYGFIVTPEPPLEWDEVPVDKSLTFETLAQIAECSPETLGVFNPELRQFASPPPEDGKPYVLRIPKGHKEAFERNYQPIASQVGPVLADVQIRRHRVRRGESLYSISKRYGVPMRAIARANRLRNWHSLRIGQRLEIPVPASGVAARQLEVPSAPGMKKIYYTVRPMDTLSEIAEAHNVGLSKIRRWNGLRPGSSYIRVGQKLVVWIPASSGSTSSIQTRLANIEGMEKYTYTVRPGDTLSQIAEAHGVGLSKLRQWNGLKTNSSHIRIGQRLVIWKQKG
ncbi:MAG: LysM peptidoglycan-binding domain-containing protein [Fidelibacterota bacterium]|nr:MAG: LysM peptidoglycan-binding domain-containing protein [Candidatus Neomarinimicrobiota bacterium]